MRQQHVDLSNNPISAEVTQLRVTSSTLLPVFDTSEASKQNIPTGVLNPLRQT